MDTDALILRCAAGEPVAGSPAPDPAPRGVEIAEGSGLRHQMPGVEVVEDSDVCVLCGSRRSRAASRKAWDGSWSSLARRQDGADQEGEVGESGVGAALAVRLVQAP
ncbi:hypothetical protein ACFXAS_13740 [Streptomyces sp. NPDC059459]|uniref:hypothetical protein n=1 Tax=Streptomyces sp. NPDC059459 TaxID=3346839 RepID=UPI0036A337C2